jgi:hypothetical protein
MVYFKNKIPHLGKFWSVLQLKMFINFRAIWSRYVTAILYILWPCGICFCHFLYFVCFGMLYQEKSGNSDMLVLLQKLKMGHKQWKSLSGA